MIFIFTFVSLIQHMQTGLCLMKTDGYETILNRNRKEVFWVKINLFLKRGEVFV